MSAPSTPRAFAKLLMDLGSRPQERSLDQLFDSLGLDQEEFFLTKLATADRTLGDCGVDVQPRLQNGSSDGVFLFRQANADATSEAEVKERLEDGESASKEFKSTYWCDLQRRTHQPDATPKQLRSNDVRDSTLKSLAGFLTTGGGRLFIGVGDAGEVLGLRPDLEILRENQRNVDRLINNIKTDIAERFRDGNTVNGYVRIEAVAVGDEQILQLEVTCRRSLSFLDSPKLGYRLYRRQDNRTVQVEIYEVEEFQEWRGDHILSETA